MTRRTLSGLILAAAMLVLCSQAAFALPETSAYFDQATQQVNFSITGGDVGTTYTIHVAPTGCVDTAAGGTVDLVGPDASGSVILNCLTPNSSGGVAVSFCMDVVCFDTKELGFNCRSNCGIYSSGPLPALSHWGMASLIVLLIGTAIWVVRRKKVPVQ
jgi:hypothetical protein